MQLACIGVIGQYLGRMYDEIKNRPLFLVRGDTAIDARAPHDPDRTLPDVVMRSAEDDEPVRAPWRATP